MQKFLSKNLKHVQRFFYIFDLLRKLVHLGSGLGELVGLCDHHVGGQHARVDGVRHLVHGLFIHPHVLHQLAQQIKDIKKALDVFEILAQKLLHRP